MVILQNVYNGKECFEELEVSRKDRAKMRKKWDIDFPHFGNIAPHRYQETDKYHQVRCVYCWEPQSYKKVA